MRGAEAASEAGEAGVPGGDGCREGEVVAVRSAVNGGYIEEEQILCACAVELRGRIASKKPLLLDQGVQRWK